MVCRLRRLVHSDRPNVCRVQSRSYCTPRSLCAKPVNRHGALRLRRRAGGEPEDSLRGRRRRDGLVELVLELEPRHVLGPVETLPPEASEAEAEAEAEAEEGATG